MRASENMLICVCTGVEERKGAAALMCLIRLPNCLYALQDPSSFLFLFDTPSSSELIVSRAKLSPRVFYSSSTSYIRNHPYHVVHSKSTAFFFNAGLLLTAPNPASVVSQFPSDGLLLPVPSTSWSLINTNSTFSDEVSNGLVARGVLSSSVLTYMKTETPGQMDVTEEVRMLYRWEYQVLRLW